MSKRKGRQYTVFVRRRYHTKAYYITTPSPTTTVRTHEPATYARFSTHSTLNKAKAKCVELRLMDADLISVQVRRLGEVLFRL